jgi:hypothetical protein
MQNPIEQYNKTLKIGKAKFDVLNKIKRLLKGDFIITGSFSLVQFDVVSRPINDLDLIVSSDLEVENLLSIFGGKRFNFSEYLGATEVRQKHELCISSYFVEGQLQFRPVAQLMIDKVKVDLFVQSNINYETVTYWRPDNEGERQYKVALPIYSIEAKRHYIQSLGQNMFKDKIEKHLSDIESYNQLNK